jgi:glutathione peroxidase
MSIFDYVVKSYDGKDISLCNYMGEVLLVVNTATRCGFTKQYQKLQELYDKYKDDGLVILDFPCNQFSHQAPESDLQIHEFRKDKYNVDFPQFKKIKVNGKNTLPLFQYLKSQANIKKID